MTENNTAEATESPAQNNADATLPTPDELRAELKARVRDPELGMNVVDLGLIYDIEVTPQRTAEVTMTLTSPGCPVGPQIIADVQRTLHTCFPNLEEVNVHITWTPFWNPDMMSPEAKDELGIF
ncbi:MAG: metal-sulfur cluster assembly factor [Caldilineae bacterium]|nr:MAG: metal-sulfur cluster assembly factor [Caldilineae bacterium]